jgi:hypothetical protein
MTAWVLVEPMENGSTAYSLFQAWSVWAELIAPLMISIFILAFKEFRSGTSSLPRLQPWIDRCDTSRLCTAFVEPAALLPLFAVSALLGHFLLFRWIVWMANLPALSIQLKIVALLLLIFGFHFTLLCI